MKTKHKIWAAADFETLKDKVVAFSYTEFLQVEKLADTVRFNDWLDNIKPTNNTTFMHGNNALDLFFDFLNKTIQKDTVIFFHNLRNFDGHFIIPWLLNQGYKQSQTGRKNNTFAVILSKGKILSIKLRINKKTVYFRDSMNYFTTSLDNLTKMYTDKPKINVQELLKNKLNLNFESETKAKEYFFSQDLTKATPEFIECFKEYTIRDTESLGEAIKNHVLITKEDISAKITSSGYSEEQFKNLYAAKYSVSQYLEKFKVKVTDESLKQHQEFKKYYFGGYTYANVNKLSQKIPNVWYYDINSSYPSVMAENLPYGLAIPLDDKDEIIYDQKYDTYYYEILIKSGHTKYTPIIRRTYKQRFEKESHFIYKIEQPIIYQCFKEELQYFELYYDNFKYDIIRKWGINTHNTAGQFIRQLYKERSDLKQEFKTTQNVKFNIQQNAKKTMLNALYGKHGQAWLPDNTWFTKTPEKYLKEWQKNTEPLIYDNKTGNYDVYDAMANNPSITYHVKTVGREIDDYRIVTLEPRQLFIEHPEKDYNRNVLIASYITTKARIKLYDAIYQVYNTEDAEYITCDTDSIIVQFKTEEARQSWESKVKIDDKQLGAWKVEKSNIHIWVKQEKFYFTSQHSDFRDCSITAAGYPEIEIDKVNAEDLFVHYKTASRKTNQGVILENKVFEHPLVKIDSKGYRIIESYDPITGYKRTTERITLNERQILH